MRALAVLAKICGAFRLVLNARSKNPASNLPTQKAKYLDAGIESNINAHHFIKVSKNSLFLAYFNEYKRFL